LECFYESKEFAVFSQVEATLRHKLSSPFHLAAAPEQQPSPRLSCSRSKQNGSRLKGKEKRQTLKNTYESLGVGGKKRIVNYLFQMFVDPFCESFLLDCISFVCGGREKNPRKRKNALIFGCWRKKSEEKER
jgi:hypothetical protein